MKANELRTKFLNFFKEKGHEVIPSASLVPKEQDITESDMTLFISAGMQQFKRFYVNPEEAQFSRVISSQKCIRTVDIDEVGDDTHLSFFEMLGNFSFGYPEKRGSYFKPEAIAYAWEFLTEVLKFDKSRIHATYFEAEKSEKNKSVPTDTESKELLEGIDGLKKIVAQGDDNFWSLGSEGSPGGPTVEFYIDDIEVWNLVFNEYVMKDGKYEPMELKGVDTGMGLERLLTTLNGNDNVYETDLFEGMIKKIEEISGKKYEDYKSEFRVIADHVKTAVFAVHDGIEPSNKGNGYVVRRLIRRAIVKASQIGIDQPFMWDLVVQIMFIYNQDEDLIHHEDIIVHKLKDEEEKFRKTLALGLKQFERRIAGGFGSSAFDEKAIGSGSKNEISGEQLFDLYQTYGFPLELSLEIAKDKKVEINTLAIEQFNNLLKAHQDLSRTASAGMFKGGLAESGEQVVKYHTATHLLLAALRKVVGEHVTQKGSNITAERLRFDFSQPEKLTPEQIKQVEDLVNEQIAKNLPVHLEEMSVDEAKAQGAMGVFEAKYGEKVKVYTVGESTSDYFSKEICGGPHVKNISELGHFKITKEESSSAGVRRIKAVLE